MWILLLLALVHASTVFVDDTSVFDLSAVSSSLLSLNPALAESIRLGCLADPACASGFALDFIHDPVAFLTMLEIMFAPLSPLKWETPVLAVLDGNSLADATLIEWKLMIAAYARGVNGCAENEEIKLNKFSNETHCVARHRSSLNNPWDYHGIRIFIEVSILVVVFVIMCQGFWRCLQKQN